MANAGARVIDGKSLSAQLRTDIARRAGELRKRGFVPRLDAVLVAQGDTPARQYAESQARTCAELGIECVLHEIPSPGHYDDIAGRVLLLNTKEEVAAVMVHLPLPESVDTYSIQRLIDPDKDVEGVNPANIGNVVYGRSSLSPCTALAAVKMIEHAMQGAALAGKTCVVVGASNHVGKPIAVLLMRQEATVISCNKFTRGIEGLMRDADVLIAAAGVPRLIKADMVKPGAIVIDVGVNRIEDPATPGKMKTVGDVDYDAVREKLGSTGWISPVPGGVGPMTVATLLYNVLEACERAAGGRSAHAAPHANPRQ